MQTLNEIAKAPRSETREDNVKIAHANRLEEKDYDIGSKS